MHQLHRLRFGSTYRTLESDLSVRPRPGAAQGGKSTTRSVDSHTMEQSRTLIITKNSKELKTMIESTPDAKEDLRTILRQMIEGRSMFSADAFAYAKVLIEAYPDVLTEYIDDQNKFTPLMYCVQNTNNDSSHVMQAIIGALLSSDSNPDLLLKLLSGVRPCQPVAAMIMGNMHIFKKMSKFDNENRSILWHACKNNHHFAIPMILMGSTDDSRDLRCKEESVKELNALSEACKHDNLLCVRMLLSFEQGQQLVDHLKMGIHGSSALMVTCSKPSQETEHLNTERIAKELLDHSPDLELKDCYGRTALMYASYWNPNLVQLLLKSGANVNAQDVWGTTPLMIAVIEGQREICHHILDSRNIMADVTLRDQRGLDALALAQGRYISVRIAPNDKKNTTSADTSANSDTLAKDITADNDTISADVARVQFSSGTEKHEVSAYMNTLKSKGNIADFEVHANDEDRGWLASANIKNANGERTFADQANTFVNDLKKAIGENMKEVQRQGSDNSLFVELVAAQPRLPTVVEKLQQIIPNIEGRTEPTEFNTPSKAGTGVSKVAAMSSYLLRERENEREVDALQRTAGEPLPMRGRLLFPSASV